MNVNELVDELAKLIAAGRGNDQVLVGLYGDTANEVDGADGSSGFVQLGAKPEGEL